MSTASLILIRANALLHSRAEVLADFEQALVREVHDRVIYRAGAAPTPAELDVINDALSAMLSAPTQSLTTAGLAA